MTVLLLFLRVYLPTLVAIALLVQQLLQESRPEPPPAHAEGAEVIELPIRKAS